jgi:hypothetical protein
MIYNFAVRINKDSAISSAASVLELFTALCGVALTFYIIFASKSRILLQMASDFCRKHQPLLGLILMLVVFCWFFVIGAAMLFPFSVRADSADLNERRDLKYLFSLAGMGLGPWLDVLIMSLSKGFSIINIDRVAIQYLGMGSIALFLAGISGRAPSRTAAIIISLIALTGFAVLYAGLWLVGGMGSIFSILVWHGTMLYVAYSVFQEWLWFIRSR